MGKPRRRSIRRPKRPSDSRCLRFSFQYLQPEHPKFRLENCTVEFYQHLIAALCRYSAFTVDEFKDPRAPYEDHRHKIDFSITTEKAGFPDINPETTALWTDEPWQFALAPEPGVPQGGWRVHGFIEADIFFIVWLDEQHRLSLNRNYQDRTRNKKKVAR